MIYDFLSGAIAMGFIVAGLFFLRFWRRTGENLFLAFASAFWILGASQSIMTLTNIPVEERSGLYLLRLMAFLIILVSVGMKNRRA